MKDPNVAIFMGSETDKEKIVPALKVLHDFGVGYEIFVISAHRTPQKLANKLNVLNAQKNIKVIIAAAGMSAGLPGAIAGQTIKPVIGVPLSSKSSPVNDLAALFAIAQMPPGIPTATVAIDGAKNAAYLALQILALTDTNISDQLRQQREDFVTSSEEVNLRIDLWAKEAIKE